MKTIGLYFGSFNPVHMGHVKVCQCALENGIDEIIVIPAWKHPLKDESQFVDFDTRYLMCCMLFHEKIHNGIKISTVEKEAKTSFTCDTIDAIILGNSFDYGGIFKDIRESKLRLVIGSDILDEIDKWKNWQGICQIAPPFVAPRIGHSSTNIRKRIQGEQTKSDKIYLREALGAQVANHIEKNGLYRGHSNQGPDIDLLDLQ